MINFDTDKVNKLVNFKSDKNAVDKLLLLQLFFCNLVGLILAYCDPFDQYIFKLITTTNIVMTIIGIFTMFFVYGNRTYYLLLSGINSIFACAILFTSIYKLFHLMIGMERFDTIVLLVIISISILSISIFNTNLSLKSGRTFVSKYNSQAITFTAGLLGYFAMRFVFNNFNMTVSYGIFGLCIIYFLYYAFNGIFNIYKSYLKISNNVPWEDDLVDM